MSETSIHTGERSEAAPSVSPPSCLDCGAPVVGAYCQQCGQRHEAGVLPLRSFFADIAADVFSIDGRLLRTVRPLLTHPGFLTNEYLAGRRSRYVPPFRLYLAISVVYLFVLATSGASKFFFFYIRGADPQFAQFVRLLPRLMFLLLPAFAVLLAALYRGRLYVAHLVFALHYHAFAFLVLPVDALLDARLNRIQSVHELSWVGILGLITAGFVQLWVLIYLAKALRRVYGGSRLMTLIKTVVLFFGYLAILMIVGLLSVPALRKMLIEQVFSG